MDAILKQLTNPEWWFTVVGMGLVIGIAGSYAKDWLAIILSSVSETLKQHFEKQKKEDEARALRMVRAPQLLVVEYLRSALTLGGSVLLIAMSFVLPAWHVLQTSFPAVDLVTSVLGMPAPSARLSQLFALMSGFFGVCMWTKGLMRLRFCELVRSVVERGAA